MSLTPDSQFGNYQIGEVIGEGGMGQVYRATDTTLDREVAIKVLPESFATDQDRISRFEREAKTLASLNHPNIAQIYGLEAQGGTTAIVMELVEGPTLADRIAEGPVPAEEALRIAKQVIDGLEAAHDKGIVHRDLKPANIKLREDGSVKILDFGIAKPMDVTGASGGISPTRVTPAVTETGVIMGTAAYMSPEQARGKFVDQRTDIWAFGCLLFEMLTGQPAFVGEDVMITLAKVLANDSDLDSIPATISPAVRHTLKLCLAKDPNKRIHHIGDVRMAMAGDFESPLAAMAAESSKPKWQFWLKAAPLALALAAVVGAGIYYWMQPVPGPVNRFSYTLPADQQFRNAGRNVFALSPDGRYFVYNTTEGLYLRSMGELDARLIPGTEEPLVNPFFSPDSQSIAYWTVAGGELKRISVSGGAPVVIATTPAIGGASWASDNNIYYAAANQIFRVSANGGTPEMIVDLESEAPGAGSPELLPDGDTLIFTAGPPGRTFAQSLATGERWEILPGSRDAHYLPSGHLVYSISPGRGLFAIRFDLDTLTTSGGPVPLVQDVLNAGQTAPVNYGIASDGTLAYVFADTPEDGVGLGNRTVTWVDHEGNEEPINLPPRNYDYARVSPDGNRMVFSFDGDLWVSDVNRPVLNRITATDRIEFAPMWTQDSQNLVFSELATRQIFATRADGTGETETLARIDLDGAGPGGGALVAAGAWVPDRTALLFTYGRGAADPKIGLLNLDRPNNDAALWEPFLDREAGASALDMSPNGEWIAYHADDTGQYGVYIERFPSLGDRQLVSDADGGWGAWWSPDGQELYYRRLGDGAMMAVSIQTTPTLAIGTPRVLFPNNDYYPPNTPAEGGASAKSWAIAPDGRFLMIKNGSTDTETRSSKIIIVQNWTEELKRQVPTE